MTPNPFDDLEQLFDRMESQFEGSTAFGSATADVNLLDRGDVYLLEAELPGFEAEDLELTYADGHLYLEAERLQAVEREDDASYVRRERSTTVDRTISVPEGVDESAIEADLENGVLTVTLPKVDPDEGGRRIEIE